MFFLHGGLMSNDMHVTFISFHALDSFNFVKNITILSFEPRGVHLY